MSFKSHARRNRPVSPESRRAASGSVRTRPALLKYVLTASNGFIVVDCRGTEHGSPGHAFPKFKANGTVSWNIGGFGASFTGRYIDAVTEINPDTGEPNKLGSRFYDFQLGFSPGFRDERFSLTAGVNNVFDKDPPACFSCSLNNFDPTTYDVRASSAIFESATR
jgi:iron complex outermembrane receptor protein